MDDECLQIAALNRPIYPGMLYDCRDHSFIPGVTLWNKKELDQTNLLTIEQQSADIEVMLSTSKDDRVNSLGVHADLSLSLMAGTIHVRGSADYLQIQNSKKNTARVVLKYKTRTHSVFLSMDQLGEPYFKDVFKDKMATHVCAGVEYGLDVFFVFEKTVTDSTNAQTLSGNVEAAMERLVIAVKGHAKIDSKDKTDTFLEETSCRYIGDFIPEKIPTSFMDAVHCIQSLPANMKEDKIGKHTIETAKIIHLYPLSKLNKAAAVLVCLIDGKIVLSLSQFIQSYDNLNDDIQHYIDQEIVKTTSFLKAEVGKLQEVCQIANERFMTEIVPIITKVRSGEEKSEELVKILDDYRKSKCSPNVLKQHLELLAVQISCVQLVIDYATKSKKESDDDLIKNMIGVHKTCYLQPKEEAIGFTFNEKTFQSKALDDLYDYVKEQANDDLKDQSITTCEDPNLEDLNNLLIRFVEYANDYNIDEPNSKKFIINSDAEFPDDKTIAYTTELTWYGAKPWKFPVDPPTKIPEPSEEESNTGSSTETSPVTEQDASKQES